MSGDRTRTELRRAHRPQRGADQRQRRHGRKRRDAARNRPLGRILGNARQRPHHHPARRRRRERIGSLRPDGQRGAGGELDAVRRIPHPHQLQAAEGDAADGRPEDPHHHRGFHGQPHGRILQLHPADAAPAKFPLCRGPLARTAPHHRGARAGGQLLAPRPAASPRGLQRRQFEIHVPARTGHRLAHPHQRTAGQREPRRKTLHLRHADPRQQHPRMGRPAGEDPFGERLAADGRARQHA